MGSLGVAAGAGINPATILHLLVCVCLIIIAWFRGAYINKKWIVMFSIMALLFDFLPVLNIIPYIPTLMYLLTLILGVIGTSTPAVTETVVTKSKSSFAHAEIKAEIDKKDESFDRVSIDKSSGSISHQDLALKKACELIDTDKLRKIDSGSKSKWVIPLAVILAIESFALIFISANLKTSKDELRSALIEKENILKNTQQETQARITAENQLQSAKQAYSRIEQQLKSEQQAHTVAEQRIQTEVDAKRTAERKALEAQRIAQQETETRRQAETAESKSIAREQALVSQKNAAEIEAKRRYETSLARIENDYRNTQRRLEENYQRQLSTAAGKADRISRAKERYQEDLGRADKTYNENKVRAETLYKDELTRAQKNYQQLSSSK